MWIFKNLSSNSVLRLSTANRKFFFPANVIFKEMLFNGMLFNGMLFNGMLFKRTLFKGNEFKGHSQEITCVLFTLVVLFLRRVYKSVID